MLEVLVVMRMAVIYVVKNSECSAVIVGDGVVVWLVV